MFTNKVVKTLLEIIGDIDKKGYSINDIPILLNKDKNTEYPQIRLSPFIEKYDRETDRYIEPSLREYRYWEEGVFQVDIYTRRLAEAQNAYEMIKNRIYDYFNIETLVYEWNPDFLETNDEDIYKNINYAVTGELFKDIYSVYTHDKKFKRVYNYDELDYNTFYADEEALYVKTKRDVNTLHIKVLLQGRLFENGDNCADRGFHFYTISKQRNLSLLEDNEVERISFDITIVYSYKRERETIPPVNRIKYPVR